MASTTAATISDILGALFLIIIILITLNLIKIRLKIEPHSPVHPMRSTRRKNERLICSRLLTEREKQAIWINEHIQMDRSLHATSRSTFRRLGAVLGVIEPMLVICNALGIMALCTMFYGYCQRRVHVVWVRRLFIGLAFGSGGAVMMMQPLDLSSGFQADPRTAFVGMAAAFGGWISGTVAAGIVVGVRLWIGGEGTTLGVAIAMATLVSAGAWRVLHPSSLPRTSRHMAILSTLLIIPLCLSFVRPEAAHVAIILILAALIFIDVFMFGFLMDYEQMRGRREHALCLAALTDALTSLPNRRAFEEETQAREGRKMLALFIVDIDHFKSINDVYGHDAGDFVLRKCASAIRTTLRDEEVCARLGGEEFGIVISAANRDEVMERMEGLRVASKTEVQYQQNTLAVTVSVGGYYSTERAFASDYYLRRADEALYKAKRAGRDRSVLVGSSVEESETVRMRTGN